MRTLALINQKGGVGKTTAAANLGHALALAGHRVILVDLDPQGHLAVSLGLRNVASIGIDRVLESGGVLQSHAVPVRDNLSLVPCGQALNDFNYLQGGKERAFVLAEAIGRTDSGVDYLVLDCPPSSGMIAVNAVVAADTALVPVAGDYLSLTGVARLMLTLRRLEPLRASPLRQFVFLSRFLPRRRLAREVKSKLLQHFPEQLLHTAVREAAVLAECAGAAKSIFEYCSNSPSADEFRELAQDILLERIASNEQEAACDVA